MGGISNTRNFFSVMIVTKLFRKQFRVFQSVLNFFTKGTINDTTDATLLVRRKFLFVLIPQTFPLSVLRCRATASLASIKSLESLFQTVKTAENLQLHYHISVEIFRP